MKKNQTCSGKRFFLIKDKFSINNKKKTSLFGKNFKKIKHRCNQN